MPHTDVYYLYRNCPHYVFSGIFIIDFIRRCLTLIKITSGAGVDDEKSLLMSQMSLEKRFGQSTVFVASTLMENGGVPQSATPESLLKEAIHVISCGYEDKTEWGSEVTK